MVLCRAALILLVLLVCEEPYMVCLAESFSIVLLPDTQHYVETNVPDQSRIFMAQTAWIVSNKEARNIRFVLHEGDITENTASKTNAIEWQRARGALELLDGVVPYAFGYGNHDYFNNPDWSRNTGFLNSFFPLSLYTDLPTFGGAYKPNRVDNTYHVMRAGGIDWLILALEWGPRDEVLQWCHQVISAHSNRQVILLTHCFLFSDGKIEGTSSRHTWDPHEYLTPANSGIEIWDKLVRRHSNMAFVFCGHVPGVAHCTMHGDYGNAVNLFLTDFQVEANGGNGYLQILTFDPGAKSIRVETFSPYLNRYRTDFLHQYALNDVACFSTAAPAPPVSLAADILDSGDCRITWRLPGDSPEPASCYVVYRNGAEIATCHEPSYIDEAVKENTTNYYSVAGIGNGGRWSACSENVEVVTPPDRNPPRLVYLGASSRPTEVKVKYDQPVKEIYATTLGNYFIGKGIVITSASLGADEKTITLGTTPLTPGVHYPMRVSPIHAKTDELGVMSSQHRMIISYQPELLLKNFEDGDMNGWTVVDSGTELKPSAWSVQTGRLYQASKIYAPFAGSVLGRAGTFVYWNHPAALMWTDYEVGATLHPTWDGGMGMLFRLVDSRNYYRFEMDSRDRFRKLFRAANGQEELLAWSWEGHAYNRDYRLVIHVQGSQICVFLDGSNVFGRTITDDALPAGTIGLYTWRNTGYFDDVVVSPLWSRMVEDDLTSKVGSDWLARIVNAVEGDELATANDILADDDFDGDGVSNYGEYLADTDPIDRSSVLWTCDIACVQDNRVVLRWPSVTTRFYGIMRSNRLAQGFVSIASCVPGQVNYTTYTDQPPDNVMCFYAINASE